MKKGLAILFLLGFILLMAFTPKRKAAYPVPAGWPEPAYDFRKNPLSEKKVELGRKLFYDPVLSKDSTISCVSCHLQYTAFTHIDHPLSHGIGGKIGARNSPALMNLAWGSSFMWDGAVNHLDVQALAPISNALEMDETITNVVEKLQRGTAYPGLFYAAYGDSIITGEVVLKSISQFMLTLVSANSRYDKVKRGEDTFNTKEANGYKLFQQHCAACHTEPLFTNQKFENNGLMVDTSLNDIGHMKVTHNPADSLKFKVPTLRNVEFSAPYMHDGRFKSLSQVINNYIMGVQPSPTLSPLLKKGIYLTSNEKVDLIAFLLTLSDREFLFNPQYGYPKK
jgi:cytochrome c peroxidase